MFMNFMNFWDQVLFDAPVLIAAGLAGSLVMALYAFLWAMCPAVGKVATTEQPAASEQDPFAELPALPRGIFRELSGTPAELRMIEERLAALAKSRSLYEEQGFWINPVVIGGELRYADVSLDGLNLSLYWGGEIEASMGGARVAFRCPAIQSLIEAAV